MADGQSETAGELLYCGGTDWMAMGKRTDVAYPGLLEPHRLACMKGIPIAFVASGSASCHCVAIDTNGRCYTWGRNESGQLGHGDLKVRTVPTIVQALAEHKVVKAATGRHHTLVVTADGSAFAFGSNREGQLGIGNTKKDIETTPVKSMVSQATDVACGAEFSMWLTEMEGSTIMSAGLPQYGQLGHGTDNMYNAKEGSVKIVYEPQRVPRLIAALAKNKITRVACGNNHTVASDSEGLVFTWGFGGHGRLGHREQKDEWRPRLVEFFKKANVVQPDGVLAAGAAFSACTAGGGQLYMWGKVKSTGENWMYPKPQMDLSGWNIRWLHSGNTTSAAAADDSCITWGTSSYGELGYGPSGPKVACGVGHTLFVVSTTINPHVVENLPVFEAPNIEEKEVDDEPGQVSGDDENGKKDASAPSDARRVRMIASRKVNTRGSSKRAKVIAKSRVSSDEESASEVDEDVDEDSDYGKQAKTKKRIVRGSGKKKPAKKVK